MTAKKHVTEGIVLACDLNPSSGEGRLGSTLISEMVKLDLEVHIYSDRLCHVFSRYKFLRDRVLPIYLVGVAVFLAIIRRKRVIYLNYVPIWNFLVLFLSRFGIILGPITGSLNIKNMNFRRREHFLRKFIIPLFVKLSVRALYKQTVYWSATPSVYALLHKERVACFYSRPFLIHGFSLDKKREDFEYDVFVYCTSHGAKNLMLTRFLLEKLKSKFRICCIGDDSLRRVSHYYSRQLTEDRFRMLMQKSKFLLTLTAEDAGIVGYEAVDLCLGIVCPCDSPLGNVFQSEVIFSYENLRNDPFDVVEKISNTISQGAILHAPGNKMKLDKMILKSKEGFSSWVGQILCQINLA